MRLCKFYIVLLVGILLPNLAYARIWGKAIVKSKPTIGGAVYVSKTSGADAEQNITDKTEDTSKPKSSGFWDTKKTNLTVYFTCKPNDGYAFEKWTCTDISTFSPQYNPESKTTQNTVLCESVTELFPTNMGTYYANFVASQVLSGEVQTPTTVLVEGEPYGISEKGEVVFTVKNADSVADFTCSFEGVGFDFYGTNGTDGTYENSATFSNGKITIAYRYKADNVVGLHQGKIKLISKGADDGTTYSSVSVDISANAQFTPDFSVSSPYNYNNENAVFVGTAVASTNLLFPTPKNGAASANSAQNGQNGTIWKAWLTDDAANVFKINNGTKGSDNKYVVENGEIIVLLTSKNQGVQTATLHIQCVYYDKHGTPSNVVEKEIILTANATFSDESKITFAGQDNYIHNFGTTYTDTPVQTTIPIAIVNVKNCTPSFDKNGDVFGCVLGDLDMQLSLFSAKPGNYSATLTISGDDSREGQSGKTSATMQVSGKVLLHTPELKALSGHSQVTLRWQPIVGATEYRLQIGTETPITISADKTEYVHSNLSVNQTYTYTLTAVYAPDETYNTSATATATLGVITAESASATGLQTGTQHPTFSTFPYKKLRDIDLSAAFANGKAACDLLYIFGVTTNTDGATVAVNGKNYPVITGPSAQKEINAKTPCYIYQKDGDNYRYKETIENMNVPSKPSQFNISASGQKLYFTGYCPAATCGCTNSEDGVIFVSGGENSHIDIYLDDLQLYARMKRKDGHSGNADTASVSLGTTMYVKGSGAILTFRSSSTSSSSPFIPTLHVRGDNIFKSTQGTVVYLDAVIKKLTAGQYSSPLQVQVTKDDQCTTLNIDDIWFRSDAEGTTRVNGKLHLQQNVQSAPSIDIGDDKTILNINGGQIYLQNAIPATSQYKSAFAVSYRVYEQQVKILGVTVAASMYGVGNDQAGGTINFNDGTIHCIPLDPNKIKNYISYYRDLTSMKCPKNTKINGGTFDCKVWACESAASLGGSPTNQYGDSLNTIGFAVENISQPYNLLAEPIVFPNKYKYKGSTLEQYYQSHKPYGQNSITPNEHDSVYYMLPSDEVVQDVNLQPWGICIPALQAGAGGYKQSLGGDITIPTDANTKVSRLLYGSIDQFLIDALNNGYESPEINATIDMKDSDKHKQILNTSDYSIEDKIYMMLPVVADQWRMFVPPFDVSKVSVIEAYPEDTINKYNIGIEEAHKIQAQRTTDLLYYCCEAIVMNHTQADFESFKNAWISYTKKTYGYTPKIVQLQHATENNWFDAHYYLYHSSGTWSFDGTNFTTDWQPAAVENKQFDGTTHPVVMKQGEIYAFEFPYKQGNDYTKWDYWTGKYLLLEGYGPQTLHGTNYASEVTGDYLVPGSASLRGNATFADMTVPQKSNAYYLTTSTSGNTEQNKYIVGANQSRTLEPAEGFLLANIPASSAPARAIAINTGVVTYDQETETTTGVPTIAGGRTLIVNSVDGGLTVIPVVPQQVGIYGSAGQLIASDYMTDETTLSLPAGIYMVRGEKETAKVIVR